MILPNIFTEMYHRSVINSIEVSLKCGKLRTKRLNLRNYVKKNRNKKIRSVYCFSFIELIVSTFLVYLACQY